METFDLVENPSGDTYRRLVKVLCDHSDTFYFVTRKELKYKQEILSKFEPYTLEIYKSKQWANTVTGGPAATIYVIEANTDTCQLLQHSANTLYDWVAPELPEDLTFLKNNVVWFSCTTHEQSGGFSIRSENEKKLLDQIPKSIVQKVD